MVTMTASMNHGGTWRMPSRRDECAATYEVVHHGPVEAPEVVVCIPTMRRPHLLTRTLQSLAAQDVRLPFVCLVADNDPSGREGAAIAKAFLQGSSLAGAVIVVPRAGNCEACSAAFAAARTLYPSAPFIAMIDDDEEAEPDWLRHLLEAQERSGADLVGGPVVAKFERSDAGFFAAHPVFLPYYSTTGPVPFLYGSGNVLIRATVLDRIGYPNFDDAFNFVGGGDIDFFKRCCAAGFTAWFENGARASETVPIARTQLRWVLARSLRYGAINYMIERKQVRTIGGQARILAKSIALLGLSPIRAARRLLASRNPLIASHPIAEAVGRIGAQFRLRPEQYRKAR
ncbi:glycosyltransferase family 2 protein [Methylorubrum aminovorans]|nr:glycosyltransferase [Methylorubrum aminovorans]